MENAMQFFNDWFKSQEKFVENWVEATKTLPRPLPGMDMFQRPPGYATGDEFADLSLSWVNELMGNLTKVQTKQRDLMEDTLAKMAGESNVYKKFFDTWLPLFEAMQRRVSDTGTYQDLLDPAKYKEVMDDLFRFSPDVASELINQTVKIAEAFGFSLTEFGRPWMKAMQAITRFSPELAEGRPDTFLQIFRNLFNAFDTTFGKAFHIPAVGKDREKINLILRSLDDLAVFFTKNIEYQHRIYTTGINALGKVLETIAKKIENGEDIKTFDELLNLWIDVNEKEFLEVFKTEAFSLLQGEFLDASLNARRHFHKLMELYLFELPVALRSEMDDVYKTVYELKRKVRNLEKQAKAGQAQEAAS